MIGHDEPMCLVVMKDGIVKTICYLGHVNLESQEYDRLHTLAHSHGCEIYLASVVETDLFSSLYNEVQKAVTT